MKMNARTLSVASILVGAFMGQHDNPSEGQPPSWLNVGFGERAITLERESRTPPAQEEERRPVPETESPFSEMEANPVRPDSDPSSRAEHNSPNPSYFYCVDSNGEPDSSCLDFAAALTNPVTGAECILVREPESLNAPRCAEGAPPPAASADAAPADLPEGSEPDWELVLSQIPGEVQRAFASLPIEGGTVSFDEELLGFGYINQHTNVFAEVETQTFSEPLLGIDVDIRAVPVEYRFDYGDGTSRTSSDPGGPSAPAQTQEANAPLWDAETATSHIYRETGIHPVNVITTFIGEYRLPGAAWTPISGSVEVPATPGEADIWRLSHRHVSGACREPSHWGCSGPVELGPGDRPPKIFAEKYDSNGRYIGSQPP